MAYLCSMENAKTIRIAQARGKETNFIVVTRFDSQTKIGEMQYYHYWLTEMMPRQKKVDVGVWKVKRKEKV